MNKRNRTMFSVVVSVFIFANISTAQASNVSYGVTGIFDEPQTSIGHTTFLGSFNWDADSETVSNLQGSMNVTMHDPSMYPDLNLGYQLAQSVVGNIVTATVFLEDTSDVFMFGGYTAGDTMKYGTSFGPTFEDGNTPNKNAYFSFAFDKTTMVGILDEVVYGDCTDGGLMGQMCMTGHSMEKVGFSGTMAAVPTSISISAVPVPAAVWLFGSALLGMIGVSRKRTLSV